MLVWLRVVSVGLELLRMFGVGVVVTVDLYGVLSSWSRLEWVGVVSYPREAVWS